MKVSDAINLSLIIPIYNAEKYIPSLINNILSINGGGYEFILVDDGSTDSSFTILRQVTDERIRVYHKDNGGIASARNFGLEKSQGKYIGFMDQDDFLDSKALAECLDRIGRENGDFLVANFYTDRNGKKLKQELISEDGILDGDDLKAVADDFLTTRCKPCADIYKKHNIKSIQPTVWHCLFNRRMIIENEIKFIQFVNFEDDYIFLVQCLYSAKKVVLETNSFYTYLIHNDSTTYTVKYISDYLTKKRELNHWMYDLAVKADIGSEALYSFQCFLYTSQLRNGYRNVCSRNNENSFFEKRKELKSLTRSKEGNEKISFVNTNTPWSTREKLAMQLLKCHMYIFSLYLDKFCKLIKRK